MLRMIVQNNHSIVGGLYPLPLGHPNFLAFQMKAFFNTKDFGRNGVSHVSEDHDVEDEEAENFSEEHEA